LKDLYNQALSNYGEGSAEIINELSDFLGVDSLTPLYVVLDTIFDQLSRSDFHLSKNYTVLKGIDKSYAKWSRAFGNAVFIDSRYLIETIVEMVYNNAVNVVTRRNEDINLLLQV
jgi:hypothetical protein